MRKFVVTLSVLFAFLIVFPFLSCSGGGGSGVSDSSNTANSGASGENVSSQAMSKWDMWIGGTKLRGANLHQRRSYPEIDEGDFIGPGLFGGPFDQERIDQLAELGANYVNISHPGLFTDTPPYGVDQDVQDNLDNLLAMIAAADMFAVITFRTGPGRNEFAIFPEEINDWYPASLLVETVWTDQEAQDTWVEMWRYAADRYKNNPIVVGYDLMCEPNANESKLNISEADEFYPAFENTLYDWNQLQPRIAAAIREVDPDTPILIGGMDYSSVAWLPYLQPNDVSKTVYMIHQYEPHTYTHQKRDDNISYPGVIDGELFDKDSLENLLTIVDTFKVENNVPVSANEFGLKRWAPNAAQFMDDLMGMFEDRGMNYALWAWESTWPILAQEVDAFNFPHGPDPDNHTDVDNDLTDTITDHWRSNTLRPSNTPFTRPGD